MTVSDALTVAGKIRMRFICLYASVNRVFETA